MSPSSPRHILVARECCIGDILMSTPLIRSLNEKWPEAEIDFMVGEWSRPILADNRRVSELVPYLNIRKTPFFKLPGHLLQLRKKSYDMAFALDVGRAPNLMLRLIGAKRRFGFDYQGNGGNLTDTIQREVNDLHEREAFLRLGELAGAPRRGEKMECWLNDEERKVADSLLRSLNIGPADKLVGLFPAGGANPGSPAARPGWFPQRFKELADDIYDAGLATVLIFGGPKDGPTLDIVCDGLQGGAYRIEGLEIKQLAAVIDRCHAFVTNDCGPMHIAAAVGTPLVVLYGPTDTAFTAPAGEEHIFLRSGDCQPCYQQIIGHFETCDDAACMKGIEVPEVLAAVKTILARETD